RAMLPAEIHASPNIYQTFTIGAAQPHQRLTSIVEDWRHENSGHCLTRDPDRRHVPARDVRRNEHGGVANNHHIDDEHDYRAAAGCLRQVWKWGESVIR